jgi:hypothetical protein
VAGGPPAVVLADGVPVVLACCVPAVILPDGAPAGLAALFPINVPLANCNE